MYVKLLPSTLYGRFLLMILFPILALQIITIVIFYERHWENVVNRMQYSVISEIELVTSLLMPKEITDQKYLLSKLKLLDLNIKILPVTLKHNIPLHNLQYNKVIEDFTNTLRKKIEFPITLDYLKDNMISYTIILPDKTLSINFSSKRIKSPTTYIFILWIIITSIIFALISLLFMKNQIRSILKLAKAAEKLGKGQKVKNFKPSGAKEIKIAGLAFVKMQKRIERQISHRTKLLAHISHDLRTPITRIKLRLSLLNDDKSLTTIHNNLNEMEKMLQNYLEFAKEDGNEKNREVSIISLIKDILAGYEDERISFKFDKLHNANMFLKTLAIKRALSNIIGNSIKFAKDKIQIFVSENKESVMITVDDDGVGIDENLRNEALKPFNKLNESKDGFGLGLSIANSIVSAHGGKISLLSSPIKGLRVILTLPK